MQVCKLFLKIIKKNVFLFILYFSIFTLISVFMIQAQQNQANYQEQKIQTAVFVEEESKQTEEFMKFLEEYIELVQLRDGQSVADALFWDEIDLYLVIPKDFYENVLAGKSAIKIQASPDSLKVTSLTSILSSYFNTIKESISLGVCQTEDALAYTTKMFLENDSYHIELVSKESNGGVRGVFDMSVYIICALILSIVGIISFEMRTTDISRRLRISSYSTTKRNLMLALCYIVFAIVFVGVISCIAMALFPNQITSRFPLYILNAIFFAMISVFMALFLSSLFKSDMAYSCVANVLPLATAFLCGCFISLDLLPEATKVAAHIFPQLYIVMGNQYIQTASTFQFWEYMKIIWPCFLFIAIFIIGSIMMTNHMSKSEN